MSSTAILLQQLTESAELNRTHGRLAFSMLLFQDLAFVPFLALGGALVAGQDRFELSGSLVAVIGGALAIVAVLAAGRWLLRPLFHEIAHSRLRELFTLACCWWCSAQRGVAHRRPVVRPRCVPVRHDARRDRIPAPDRSGKSARFVTSCSGCSSSPWACCSTCICWRVRASSPSRC